MHFEPGVGNAVKVSIATAAEFGPQIKSNQMTSAYTNRSHAEIADLVFRSVQYQVIDINSHA